MERIETYCQEEFLIYFFENYVVDPIDSKNRICNSFYDLLLSKAEIGVDSTEKLTANISNPYVKHLIKTTTSGGSKLIPISSYFQNILENKDEIFKCNPTSLHFLKTHLFANTYSFGVYLADLQNYISKIKSISLAPITIKVHPSNDLNEFEGWSTVTSELPPRNSLIITDNFFLNNENKYKQNVFQLLTSFLPDELYNQDFHLTIITNRELQNPEKKFKSIRQYLNLLNKPYNIRFGLYLAEKIKPHDRDLISNYFRINVGHSFELLNENGRPNKDTSITYFPINSGNSPATHFKFLKTFASYIKDLKPIGDDQNRLLEYFK